MQGYRQLTPAQPVFPKLHYLEDHILPFIKRWRVGPGLLGEHGGESVHALFNQLHSRYSSIPDVPTRLLHMMKFHCLQANPATKEAPKPKPRK